VYNQIKQAGVLVIHRADCINSRYANTGSHFDVNSDNSVYPERHIVVYYIRDRRQALGKSPVIQEKLLKFILIILIKGSENYEKYNSGVSVPTQKQRYKNPNKPPLCNRRCCNRFMDRSRLYRRGCFQRRRKQFYRLVVADRLGRRAGILAPAVQSYNRPQPDGRRRIGNTAKQTAERYNRIFRARRRYCCARCHGHNRMRRREYNNESLQAEKRPLSICGGARGLLQSGYFGELLPRNKIPEKRRQHYNNRQHSAPLMYCLRKFRRQEPYNMQALQEHVRRIK